MTKHILIAGVPRAGKSTVSSRIAKRFGYQHVSMDSIIAGFEHCFPELGIDTYAPLPQAEVVSSISRKLAPFLRAMMDSGEYDERDYGMVLDMYQLLPEDYVNYIDPKTCAVYYFVTAEVTPEERFRLLKQYDTPEDYTYFEPEEKNRENCRQIVEQSALFKAQCERYGLPCFETSRDREAVLEKFLESLAKEMGLG